MGTALMWISFADGAPAFDAAPSHGQQPLSGCPRKSSLMTTFDDSPIDLDRSHVPGMTARTSWFGRPRPVELALTCLVLILGTGELWVPFSSRQGHGNTVADTVAVLLVALSLLYCRREPLVP